MSPAMKYGIAIGLIAITGGVLFLRDRDGGHPRNTSARREQPWPSEHTYDSPLDFDENSSVVDDPPESVRTETARGEISITVSGADGEAVPQTDVHLILDEIVATQTTDENGAGLFTHLAPDSYGVHVHPRDKPRLTLAHRVVLAPDTRYDLEVVVPDFDRAVSGHVLNQKGSPVAGIEVRAETSTDPSFADLVVQNRSLHRSTSDVHGAFRIDALPQGNVRVSIASQAGYLPVETDVYAGDHDVELTLRPGRIVEIRGHVRSQSGAPIFHAAVATLGRSAVSTRSEQDGSYALRATANAEFDSIGIVARHPQFKDAQETLSLRLNGTNDRTLDLTLQPRDELTAQISGFVRSRATEEPLPSELVQVYSAKRRFRSRAITGADGSFFLNDVPVGDGYRIWMAPRSDHRDWVLAEYSVSEASESLSIYLEPLGSARLLGELVDPDGNRVRDQTVSVRSIHSERHRVEGRTDERGEFQIENSPIGEVEFSIAKLATTVTDVQLPNDTENTVRLIVDAGDFEVSGEIVSSFGSSIKNANVVLTSRFESTSGMSRSRRVALSDEGGKFQFVGLGRGPHELNVVARHHESTSIEIDVNQMRHNVRVQLSVSDD